MEKMWRSNSSVSFRSSFPPLILLIVNMFRLKMIMFLILINGISRNFCLRIFTLILIG